MIDLAGSSAGRYPAAASRCSFFASAAGQAGASCGDSDVSGSMTLYARVFLAFLRGLIDVDQGRCFPFHTSLMCVSDALRDSDTLRAVNRLSMMARDSAAARGSATVGTVHHQYAAACSAGEAWSSSCRTVMTAADQRRWDRAREAETQGLQACLAEPASRLEDYAPVAASMAAAMPIWTGCTLQYTGGLAASRRTSRHYERQGGQGIPRRGAASRRRHAACRGDRGPDNCVHRSQAGMKAIILENGAYAEGWLGGGCVTSAVRRRRRPHFDG